jgi:c-di-GMP phosphodiesterase
MQDNEHLSEDILEDIFDAVFVARQPIFDRKLSIWGYELLFRHSAEAATAQVLDQDQATAKVIADGFVLASTGVASDKRLLINFPRNLLLQEAALALPRQVCVVEILETVEPTQDIIDVLRKTKKAGYTLALDDFVGQEGYEDILGLADIVKVEVLNLSPEELRALTQRLQQYGCKLLAEKVEDKETLDLLMDLGYHYFQGFYFSRPEIMPGRKISASSLAKVQLIRELAKEDYEVKDLARIISTDVSLSYRLLNYLNSPAFGMRRTIDSIHQAVTILGSRNIRQWLMVITLSDLNPSPRVAEIGFQCVQRGRFFEQAAVKGIVHHTPEGMFLLGLLSRLDALLGLRMQDILTQMPLETEIKKALEEGPSALCIWLDLALAVEHADWETAKELLDSLNFELKQAALLYNQATRWTRGILSQS